MTDDHKVGGSDTEELVAEQRGAEELLPAVAQVRVEDEIQPYDGATEVDT